MSQSQVNPCAPVNYRLWQGRPVPLLLDRANRDGASQELPAAPATSRPRRQARGLRSKTILDEHREAHRRPRVQTPRPEPAEFGPQSLGNLDPALQLTDLLGQAMPVDRRQIKALARSAARAARRAIRKQLGR